MAAIRGRGQTQLFGRIQAVSDDLRAAVTGLLAFLNEPAAGGPDAACGQRFVDGREQLDQFDAQLTIISIEMAAGFLLAGSGKTHHLCRRDRAGESEEFLGHRHRPLEPGNARRFRRPAHYAEYHAAGHAGLGTGAEDGE